VVIPLKKRLRLHLHGRFDFTLQDKEILVREVDPTPLEGVFVHRCRWTTMSCVN
jgi:hypothetical protein